MNICEFLVSVLSSLVAAAVIYIIQLLRYWKNLKLKFHDKVFNIYYKNLPEHIYGTVRCKVRKNVISYQSITNSEKVLEGIFIMDVINLRIGEGYHLHKDYEGFNFPKVIIKDNKTFFVETSYTRMIKDSENLYGKVWNQAFVWKMRLGK